MYDPTIGRWNGVDALAEERNWLTPWQYTQNNPISRIDPDGNLDWDVRLSEDGKSIEYIAEEGDNLSTLATQLGVSEASLSAYEGTEFVAGEAYSLDQLESVSNINNYLQRGDIDQTNCSNCALDVNGIPQENQWGENGGNALDDATQKLDQNFENVPESNTAVGDIVTFNYSVSVPPTPS